MGTTTQTLDSQVMQMNDNQVMSQDEIKEYVKQVAREKHISESLFYDIMMKESQASSTVLGDMNIICKQGINKGKPVRAKGLWQWTDCYHPEVSDECAFDVKCSTQEAVNYFQKGEINIWNSLWIKIK